VTFLFSTHDEKVMRHAKKLLWLVDGQIADDDPPKENVDEA
jgi:ABC-type sulfate/molybdate transport systems ATPase subunit